MDMTKTEKRARIKVLEASLAKLAEHRAKIANVYDLMANNKPNKLQLRLWHAPLTTDPEYRGDVSVPLFPMVELSPEIFMTLYNAQLDEQEVRINAELEGLIA